MSRRLAVASRIRERLPGLGMVTGWIEVGAAAGKVRENLLRALYAARLPEEGRGLLVHAASVRDPDGSAWLFPGKSGAGKSTLAGLATGTAWRAIAEDVSVVTWPAAAGRPGPRVSGALPPRAGQALGALGFLEHAPVHRAERLSRTASLRRLLECAVWFGSDGAVGAILDQAVRLVSAVPCYRMGFRPEASIWPFLEGVA